MIFSMFTVEKKNLCILYGQDVVMANRYNKQNIQEKR